ncbi:MAG TPA: PDZ domain-containing protein [Bryobacteraceae bacterium]|nr:PDZ domain-containing protein [Bryobacteraceae bacterium]
MKPFACVCVLLVSFAQASWCAPSDDKPLLLRHPTISRTQIVFTYANDLWSVSRDGGEAVRLTTGAGAETDPIFSPDGSQIAFTGEYDGNVDVYVIPASGGTPRRLTYHPAADRAVGWTPDGKQVLFASTRSSYSGFNRLFTVPAEGGFETQLPMDRAVTGAYSPDGARIAYVPIDQWQRAWKRYAGGQTTPIWVATLADSSVVKIPRNNSNDSNPMWVGDTIYFLSDRNGPVSLFAYDTKSRQVTEVVKNDGLDFKSASAGPDMIVYEQFGSLHVYDLKTRKTRAVNVRLAGDVTEMRPHFRKLAPNEIRAAGISPTGARALFTGHGEIFSVPAEKGDIRNLTRTVAAEERDPAWSPDGNSIAYFSDASGEYALEIRDQNGLGEPRRISLGSPPAFPYSPRWSPDSKKIAYTNHRLEVCYLELEKGAPVRIDADTYAGPAAMDPAWSPDSRWIAYTKKLKSHLHAVFVYSLEQNKTFQVTDGMSDAADAQFDKEGKYLYFTASTDTALSSGWLDMSSIQRPVTRSVYLAVLAKDLPSPLAPESDEEKPPAPPEAKKPEESAKKDAAVRIDFENIGQRILALPLPARNYVAMWAGKAGALFLVEAPMVQSMGEPGEGLTVQMFDLKTRKPERIREGINSFFLSANGEKMLYRQGQQFFIAAAARQSAAAAAPPAAGSGGPLKLDTLEAWVDPRAEWEHMYHQAWRDERDFFYDPGLHGVNREALEKKYEPYLENISSRDDLNYLFEEMLGEMTVGHMFIGGGDKPEVKRVSGGLLGADYTVENGRYRFARVFNGENWNPNLKAPLTQPGVNVITGEYLLAVQGREVRPPANLYSFFEETAGKSIVIRVGPDPSGANSRDITIVPIGNETALRNFAWVEDNRRKVDQMSGGRIAYVYMPNTGGSGYLNFNRYFFSQVGKEGVIIDERFNGGGDIADYVIDYLRRPIMGRFTMRQGEDITVPMEGIFGPKVMIVNEMAGSGGDAMPWLFRKSHLGPLVGMRTWGGLVGHYTGPGDLIDGGNVGTPNLAFYNLEGAWDVENHGVSPDYEVEMNPKLVREGHDPQLEKAVEVALDLLQKNPVNYGTRPSYPDYQQKKK